MSDPSCGDMDTFNMQHGYSEALVRGYRSGFLTESDYHHITQCESLEGIVLLSLVADVCRCEAESAGDRLR